MKMVLSAVGAVLCGRQIEDLAGETGSLAGRRYVLCSKPYAISYPI
jgi:hypothetical protein